MKKLRLTVTTLGPLANHQTSTVPWDDFDVTVWVRGEQRLYRFTILGRISFEEDAARWRKYAEAAGLDAAARVAADFEAGNTFSNLDYVIHTDDDRPFLPDIVVNSDAINRGLAVEAFAWYLKQAGLDFDRTVVVWKPTDFEMQPENWNE
ncbi:TPA: hypothetical protein DF272_01430 [Candidatus Falkowbacteria bacterium]|nr:hypothetical protein [Candidatus Falkowbacteria bacterium]